MKDWNNVECPECGLVNDYTIENKSGQNVCTCFCGRFLGNKPKETYDVKSIVMPFGKYKGQVISQVNDVPYFRWAYKNLNLKGGVLAAIKWKIQ